MSRATSNTQTPAMLCLLLVCTGLLEALQVWSSPPCPCHREQHCWLPLNSGRGSRGRRELMFPEGLTALREQPHTPVSERRQLVVPNPLPLVVCLGPSASFSKWSNVMIGSHSPEAHALSPYCSLSARPRATPSLDETSSLRNCLWTWPQRPLMTSMRAVQQP